MKLYPGQRFVTGVFFGDDDDGDAIGRGWGREPREPKRLARRAKFDRRAAK